MRPRKALQTRVVHWPVPWTACASGKSSDFPGVVGNPLPLVRFRRRDRFWAPLSETGPAPPTPWSKRSNFKNLEKSSTFCEKSFMHRHFPATSWLPTAPSCTPNNPPCTPGAPWVDSDRRRWDSAFFGFPPFPPTRTPHPTTPYTLRTLDHRPDSESQPQPPFFHLARQTPRFWYTLKSGPVGGRDSAVAHALQDTGP